VFEGQIEKDQNEGLFFKNLRLRIPGRKSESQGGNGEEKRAY